MLCVRNREFLFTILIAICAAPSLVVSQVQTVEPAGRILELTDVEQIQFINASLEQELPDRRADQMAILVINRSSTTLPLIEQKIREALNQQPPPNRFIDTAADLIAYAGDERSLYAIAKLIAIDDTRFSRLIGRALTHSSNWRNPFTLSYRALEIGDEAFADKTMVWVETALTSKLMQQRWAAAMLDRYGVVPSETQWAKDPISSRLKDGASDDLRISILSLAEAAQMKRLKR